MAKKKSRQQDPNESSESGESNVGPSGPVSPCVHISRAVDIGLVKKKLKGGVRLSCDTCSKGSKAGCSFPDISQNQSKEDVEESFWLCLKCAHVGCGRNQSKHALAHFNTPRSDKHDLVVDLDSWIVWCYTCETKMSLDSSRKLKECGEYVRRHLKSSTKPTVPLLDDTLSQSQSEKIPSDSNLKDETDVTKGHKKQGKTAVAPTSKSMKHSQRVRGLMNLGNTCFYNSVLQCLSVTPYLTKILEKLTSTGEEFSLPGIENSADFEAPAVFGQLGESGPLSKALLSLLVDMRSPEKHADTLRPQELLKKVQQTFPQFQGNEQHDAHELLRHLLEGVRTDDLKRFQEVILKQNGLYKKGNDAPVHVKKRMKYYGQQLQEFILGVEGIFKGQLVSIVECQDCRHCSTRFESFLDLSLPVMEDKPLPPIRKKEQTEGFAKGLQHGVTSAQAKKLKRQERKAQRSKKDEKMNGFLTVLEESPRGTENAAAEQSDADVEDNVEQDSRVLCNGKEIGESGYSSEKHNTGESDGSSPSLLVSTCDGSLDLNPTLPIEIVQQSEGVLPAARSDTNEGILNNSSVRLKDQEKVAFSSSEDKDLHNVQKEINSTTDGVKNEQAFNQVDENVEENGALAITAQSKGESVHSPEKFLGSSSTGPYSLTGAGCSASLVKEISNTTGASSSTVFSSLAASLASSSVSPCMQETLPVSSLVKNATLGMTEPPQALHMAENASDWSDFHTPEHNCNNIECHHDLNFRDQNRCFTPVDEELRITIPENGEGSIHISPVSPSEQSCLLPEDFLTASRNLSYSPLSPLPQDLQEKISSLIISDETKFEGEASSCKFHNFKRVCDVDKSSECEEGMDGSNTDFCAMGNSNVDLPCGKEKHHENGEVSQGIKKCMAVKKNAYNAQSEECISRSEAEGISIMTSKNQNDLQRPLNVLKPSENTLKSARLENEKLSLPKEGFSDHKSDASEWSKTLAPRHQSEEGECSVVSCLNQFTSLELMTGSNKVGCDACTLRQNKGVEGKTVYTNSTKQLLISTHPPVLILHLKRFLMENFRLKKLQRFVSFPITLDIASFCSTKCKDSPSHSASCSEVRYSLYGVVEHTGSLNSGHYIAYIKIRSTLEENDPRWSFLPRSRDFIYRKSNINDVAPSNHDNGVEEKWYSISDSRVVEISEAKVLKSQAYLLFYEKLV